MPSHHLFKLAAEIAVATVAGKTALDVLEARREAAEDRTAAAEERAKAAETWVKVAQAQSH